MTQEWVERIVSERDALRVISRDRFIGARDAADAEAPSGQLSGDQWGRMFLATLGITAALDPS